MCTKIVIMHVHGSENLTGMNNPLSIINSSF